ncbi:MAG TPA: hypothetical protein VFN67_19980, partial [Polyangiales bacterium]|nr:hypothetical protein [Polyangiales bacterium]
EQISRPAQVDVRSDTWAVGVTAYRMLVGRLPFQAEDTDASGLYESILAGLYQPATDLRPELPREIDDWFAQMLAVAPDNRFSSLRTASAALATLSRAPTLKAAAPPASPARPHVQATTLHDTSTRLAGAALLRLGLMVLGALLAAAGVFWWAGHSDRSRSEPARNQPVVRPAPPPQAQAPEPVQPKAAEPPVIPTLSAGTGAAGVLAQPAAQPAPVRQPPQRKRSPVNRVEPPAHVESQAPATALPKDRGF